MLTVEEAFDIVLIEEGQYLLGIDFITDTLGLTWDHIAKLFYKSAKEYAQRKPVVETKVISGGNNGVFYMPEGTIAVRAIRYDILDSYPRTMFSDFGQANYEYDIHSRKLRTFPPMSSLRVSYSREYRLTDSAPVSMSEYMVDYENEYVTRLSTKPKKGTLTISLGGKTAKEVGITKKLMKNSMGEDIPTKLIKLEGDLGQGYFNPETRDIEIKWNGGLEGDLVISCLPYYKVIEELSISTYTYMGLFKAYVLEAIPSLKEQATQRGLHNIDLNSDDLKARALFLRQEARRNLKDTIDFSAMAPI